MATHRAPSWESHREQLRALHAAALAAADPAAAVRRVLAASDTGIGLDGRNHELKSSARVTLVALGKAALAMARETLAILGERVDAGVVAYPREQRPETRGWPAAVRLFAAQHPLPDAVSLAAGEAALALVAGGREEDVVVALVSGGGSALLEALPDGISLDELCAVTGALSLRGAGIRELNTVRRALSRVKGGGLARAAAPARVLTLLVSDVVGDRPEDIASGPTVASPTGPSESLAVLERHGLLGQLAMVERHLRSGATGAAGVPLSRGAMTRVIASNAVVAEAVVAAARERGYRSSIESLALEGEARAAGRAIARRLREVGDRALPGGAPLCLVWGGETTVTVRGDGSGGRNQELALAAAIELAGYPRVALLAIATDGIDGPTPAAGAMVSGETTGRARAQGLSADAALADNASYGFFARLGDAWVTGPSGTNVNDLVIALLFP